jgi:2-C-methyl-D-erythritol 4-phosphate cytidylyltransferase
MDTALIIVAAGAGTRMGGTVRKPFLMLGGMMVIERTLLAFAGLDWITRRVVVLAPGDFAGKSGGLIDKHLESRLRHAGATDLVPGGAERIDSVMAGVAAVPGAGLLLVHDGVRPFVSRDVIGRVRDAARDFGCAVPGVAVRDTVRVVDEAGMGRGTPDRRTLRAVQTPQGFVRGVLLDAVAKWRAQGGDSASVTDEASLVEAAGGAVKVVEGDPRNMKLTGPDDVAHAEWILARG